MKARIVAAALLAACTGCAATGGDPATTRAMSDLVVQQAGRAQVAEVQRDMLAQQTQQLQQQVQQLQQQLQQARLETLQNAQGRSPETPASAAKP